MGRFCPPKRFNGREGYPGPWGYHSSRRLLDFTQPDRTAVIRSRLLDGGEGRSLIHFELNIGETPDDVKRNTRMARPANDTLVGSALPARGLVLAAGRAAEVVAFDEQVVDFFVGAADALGVPKSVAAIYGIVFASPLPLSFADIEQRLDISKGSISQGLRVLREVGAVKEVSTAADRAELFAPDLALRKLVARFIENRLGKQLDAGSARLSSLNKAIPVRGTDADELKRRLKSLSDWHSKARAILPLARTILNIGS